MDRFDYKKPPIVESVLGVQFNKPRLNSTQIGRYWGSVSERFPDAVERPALGPIPLGNSVQIAVPQAKRVLMFGSLGDNLLQLQSNRFHFNWRQMNNSAEYPRFNTNFPKFLNEWRQFSNWTQENLSENVELARAEITYINLITIEHGWQGPSSLSDIFCFAREAPLQGLDLSSGDIRFAFKLPEISSGSLHAEIKTATTERGKSPVCVFQLDVRGSFNKTDSLETWFGAAHKALLEAFEKLVVSDILSKWRSGE